MTLVFIKRDFKKDIVDNKDEIAQVLKQSKIPENYAKKLV
jgi:hypothetical protein